MKLKHDHGKSWYCLFERKLIWIVLGVFVIVAIISIQTSNIRLASFSFTKPKPIVQAKTTLPQDIQKAVENLAKKEITQEQAQANLPIYTASLNTSTGGEVVRNVALNIQQLMTANPSDKAKIKLRQVDILIGRLQDLLEKDRADQATDKAVGLIQEIGKLTDEVVKDPNVQADRGVLQALIEQYNRLQLILQVEEDKLPISAYLKVEDARQKYLVVTATASINAAPNLDAVHNIALKEVEKVVGKDFAELKAIEIISDFEAGIKPESREKLTGLEKQLAVQFEKRMLKLPKDVREKKLQDFIKYSFGNPIRQVQSFDRMKSFLSNKEIISGVDSLRKLALEKVKNRTSEASSEDKIKAFLGTELALADEAKKQPEIKLTKDQEQKLYEKIQQIVQAIFVANDQQKSEAEKLLPTDIQQTIDQLKKDLPDNNIPKIETPEGVKLPDVAKLPDDVEQAIVTAAKKKIAQEQKSKEAKLDLTVQAKDLGVSDPIILPGNILYPVKEALETISLVVILDPVAKAEKLIEIDNQKTLEAAKLVEQSQDLKTIDLALDTLKDVQNDFDKLKEHAKELDKLKQTEPEKIDQLVDKIIDNGLIRQTVLSAIEDKVSGEKFVEVEKIRSDILKDGIETLLNLTDGNVQKLTDKLEQAIEQNSGSGLKEIKAVELLTEIKKDQPQESQEIIEKGIDAIAQKLEDKILSLPEEQRVEKVLDYVKSEPGNPVVQFEAAAELKDHFNKPETIALAEGIKDEAVGNLTDLISEITDGASKKEFVDIVVGNKPEDLKIIIDIETRVTPPSSGVTVEPTPIVEEIKEIKAEVEQNIIDAYKDKPQELVQAIVEPAGHTTDILDVQVVEEIKKVLERSSEVTPEVVKEVTKAESKVVDSFVADVSKDANKTLTPVPEVVEQLVQLKEQTPASVDIKIDAAIKAEVKLIEEHLTVQVSDPQIFENYVSQIQDNPVVAKVVEQVGGRQFAQAVQDETKVIEETATKEQTQLQTTVAEVQKEVFSPSSTTVEKLPEAVQQKVEEIKKEVPAEQIPQVTVTAIVTVTTPEPTSAPAVESKPPEQPAAPAVPSL